MFLGRPGLRWRDYIIKDLQATVHDQEESTLDRKRWRKIALAAKIILLKLIIIIMCIFGFPYRSCDEKQCQQYFSMFNTSDIMMSGQSQGYHSFATRSIFFAGIVAQVYHRILRNHAQTISKVYNFANHVHFRQNIYDGSKTHEGTGATFTREGNI